MQLNPHFLFNTMNSISSLMHSDVEAADRMLEQMSSMLRMTLDRGDAKLIPLTDEIEFTQMYICLFSRCDLRARFTVTWLSNLSSGCAGADDDSAAAHGKCVRSWRGRDTAARRFWELKRRITEDNYGYASGTRDAGWLRRATDRTMTDAASGSRTLRPDWNCITVTISDLR